MAAIAFLMCVAAAACSFRMADARMSMQLRKHKSGEVLLFPYDVEDYENDTLPHLITVNGDIRLSDSYSTIEGRMEIYVQSNYGSGQDYGGTWGTVCGDKFSMTEAHVACRQLGYRSAAGWDFAKNTAFGAGNDSRPVAISGLRCNKRTQLHTLRCNYDDLGTSSSACSHDQDVAVFCNSVRLSEHPYHGQVRLMNSNTSRSSYGRVEIYQGNEWGSVCGRDINQVAADTVCRQLGYTGAISTQEAYPGSGVVWSVEMQCESSKACLSACFRQHHKWTHDCNHTYDVAVQCTFDLSEVVTNTAGNKKLCQIQGFPLTMIILCSVLALTGILTLGCAIVCCVTMTRCCRKRCCPRVYARRYEELS